MKNHSHCPACGSLGVGPTGPKSNILLVGEFPGDDEMKTGIPFSGKTGQVLFKELQIAGLDLNQFRVMNLWLHPPKKPDKSDIQEGTMGLREYSKKIAEQNEKCLQAGYNLVLEEAKGKKSILLIGSEAVGAFTEYSVSQVCGLNVPSVFSCKNVYAMVNPAIVFHGDRGVGEIRLALQKWSKFLKENKL